MVLHAFCVPPLAPPIESARFFLEIVSTRTIFLQLAGFPKAPGSSLKQEAPYRFLPRFGGPSFFNEVGPAQAFLCANDIGRAIRAVLLDNEDSQQPFSYEEVALESNM